MPDKFKKILPVVFVLGLWCFFSSQGLWASSDPPNPDDPSWTIEYLGQAWPCPDDGTPTETPIWDRNLSDANAVLLTEGDEAFLRIITDRGSSYYYSQTDPADIGGDPCARNWDADFSVGATIEFRARIAGYSDGIGVIAGDSTGYVAAYLYGDPADTGVTRRVGLSADVTTVSHNLDTTAWHTYRVTIKNDRAYLYVDGDLDNPVIGTTLAAAGQDKLRMGDVSSSAGGVIDLDYVRAYTGGMVPVTEPNFADEDPVPPADPCWAFQYLGHAWPCPDDGTPTETPIWGRGVSEGYAGLVFEGDEVFLRITSSGPASRYYIQTDPSDGSIDPAARNWDVDFSVGATVEFRARVVGNTNSIGVIAGDGSTGYAQMLLYGDPGNESVDRKCGLSGKGGTVFNYIDTTQWHTYRLTFIDDKVYMYLDGDLNNVAAGNRLIAGGQDKLRMGDLGSAYGSIDIDYIRAFTTDEIPAEPNLAGEDPLGVGDPNWSFEYLGQQWIATDDGSPTETPVWDRAHVTSGNTSLLGVQGSDKFLGLRTTAGGYLWYSHYDVNSSKGVAAERNWDGDFSVGITIEFRAKVAGLCSGSAQFWVADGSNKFIWGHVQGDPGDATYFRRVVLSGADPYELDTTAWHTYRLVVQGNKAGLYVDGSSLPVVITDLLTRTDSANEIRFGDLSSSGQGIWDIDYIRVHNYGAYPQLPGELLSSTPAVLPRSANNEIKLVCSKAITGQPAVPVSITAIAGSPNDLASSFSYALDTTNVTNDTLVITETGSVLSDETWYRVDSVGVWNLGFAVDAPTLRGDVSENGVVDLEDYALFAAAYGNSGPGLGNVDLDGDDVYVDKSDLAVLIGGWLGESLDNPQADVLFTKFPENPLLLPGDPNFPTELNDVMDCSVRRKDAVSPFMMWYTGLDENDVSRIHLANSNDGLAWTKSGMVLKTGDPNDPNIFDLDALYGPVVIWNDSKWKMWYTGVNNSLAEDKITIGYAESADGSTWTSRQRVLASSSDPDAFDSASVAYPTVIYDSDNSLFKMWYVGNDGYGYAASADGINWTRIAELSGDTGNHPEVLKVNDVYYKFYNTGRHVDYAVSLDGISWDAYPYNSVYYTTTMGWDNMHAWAPTVVYDSVNDKLYMYYYGFLTGGQKIGGAESSFLPR